MTRASRHKIELLCFEPGTAADAACVVNHGVDRMERVSPRSVRRVWREQLKDLAVVRPEGGFGPELRDVLKGLCLPAPSIVPVAA